MHSTFWMDACVAPLQVPQLLPTRVLIRLTSNLKSVIGLCCVFDDELMTFPPKRSSPATLGLLRCRHVFVLMQLFRSCSTDFVQSHNLNTEMRLPCCVIITSAKQLMLQSSGCKPANTFQCNTKPAYTTTAWLTAGFTTLCLDLEGLTLPSWSLQDLEVFLKSSRWQEQIHRSVVHVCLDLYWISHGAVYS